jgi:hypothetical protein
MKRIAFLACIAAAAAVPARAQTTPPPPAPADSARVAAPAPEARVRREPNVITAAEIEGQTASDVYELVRRLRPQWLRARVTGSLTDASRRPTSTPMASSASQVGLVLAVFVDGSPRGDVGELRRMQVAGVRELRFHPSAEAVTRWGRDYRAGVIEVTMR